VIGFPGEKASVLNGNHLEIVRFRSREDDNYLRVVGNISMLKNKITAPRWNNLEGTTG
jgi:hypothetical protein